MANSYPTLQMLADKMAESEMYAPVRAYIRGAIGISLREGGRLPGDKQLTDNECVIHSLIGKWLDDNGYKIAAQMMRTQMSKNYVESPEQYVENNKETIELLLKKIPVNVPTKLERKQPETVENGHAFTKVTDRREFSRQPIKIDPVDDLWGNGIFRKKRAFQVDQSSSDSSDSSTSTSSSSLTMSPKSSLKDELIETTKSWGPSDVNLKTDDLLPPIVSSNFLPPLMINQPLTTKKEESEIDALFDDLASLEEEGKRQKTSKKSEDEYDLTDFEEEEVEKKEMKKEEKKTKEVTTVSQIQPLGLSDGESIDELDDFDANVLSSGGSDYSF